MQILANESKKHTKKLPLKTLLHGAIVANKNIAIDFISMQKGV